MAKPLPLAQRDPPAAFRFLLEGQDSSMEFYLYEI